MRDANKATLAAAIPAWVAIMEGLVVASQALSSTMAAAVVAEPAWAVPSSVGSQP
jgi:hypothetical protein